MVSTSDGEDVGKILEGKMLQAKAWLLNQLNQGQANIMETIFAHL